MANTTNYNWETPDDTDLVKDGAAAIRTLGSSIDTTTKNLNPETTTGDISYRSATANVNTRLPLGTAGQVLKVNSGATAPEWATDASGMTNPMTTTGDTIYSSSGSTPARLGIGTAGQVLQVNSGATAPEWATPAGASTQVATFTDEKASGTDGGTFTSGAWRTRDLNTTVFNNITSCSLSSNQISLPAGTYMVNAQAPGFDISQGQTRLYNITDSSVTIAGASTYCAAGSSDATAPSLVLGAFTIAGTKTFELQHRAGETQATNGFGVATGFGVNNVYSQITITKVG